MEIEKPLKDSNRPTTSQNVTLFQNISLCSIHDEGKNVSSVEWSPTPYTHTKDNLKNLTTKKNIKKSKSNNRVYNHHNQEDKSQNFFCAFSFTIRALKEEKRSKKRKKRHSDHCTVSIHLVQFIRADHGISFSRFRFFSFRLLCSFIITFLMLVRLFKFHLFSV